MAQHQLSALEIFARLDVQRRGAITLPEFLQVLQTHSSLCRSLGFKYPLRQQSLEQFTLAFGEMDVDRLGSVDKRKFYAWYHSKKKPEAFTTSERSQLQEIVSHPLESHSLEGDHLDLKDVEEEAVSPRPPRETTIDPPLIAFPQQSNFVSEDILETGNIVAKSSCEIDRYFKLGEILAQTESLASNLSTTNQSNQLESPQTALTVFDNDFDPHSTYYYLGNIYAELPQRFPWK